MKNDSTIECLKAEVQKKFPQKLETSTDFARLSEEIFSKTGQLLSDSTLKRMWGYVNYNPKPHRSTLDILSIYLGYSSFADFAESKRENSEFFIGKSIKSSDLESGEKIAVRWLPDRKIILQYQSDAQFSVLDGGTSKLREGDSVIIPTLAEGYPLFFDKVIRNGELLPPYVAGKSSGITELERY